ncbi:hypothetical protein ACJX0J_017680 [Zea mays]
MHRRVAAVAQLMLLRTCTSTHFASFGSIWRRGLRDRGNTVRVDFSLYSEKAIKRIILILIAMITRRCKNIGELSGLKSLTAVHVALPLQSSLVFLLPILGQLNQFRATCCLLNYIHYYMLKNYTRLPYI